jgi:general secretion pathway protein E
MKALAEVPTSSPALRTPVYPTAVDRAPEVLEGLVRTAAAAGVSDVHLQTGADGVAVAWRLDGVLVPSGLLAPEIGERVLGRIKYLARLRTYQEALPQDGRIAAADFEVSGDVRVATYPTVTGEKVVLRLFRETAVAELEELGLPAPALETLRRTLAQPSGLVLFTGPAGSGKSTTLQACLRSLARWGGRHVITVEDPVELIVPGVMQTELNLARGLGYPEAVRHLLRQDPQVLMVGEIRDAETAGLVVRAALTGHLVLSTLHAGSCRGVLERLLLMERDAFAVASALTLVLNQRLVRQACPACAAAGCADCRGTGYRGRLPLVEALELEEGLRAELRQGRAGRPEVVPTLRELGTALVAGGRTTEEELMRVLGV